MGDHYMVNAVLRSVLENRHAGRGGRRGQAEVTAGGVDELVLEKYNTSRPPNHTRLVGEWAEHKWRAGEVLAGFLLDSVSGNDMEVDGVVRVCECGNYLVDSALPVWVLGVNIQGVERQARIERIITICRVT